MTGWPNQDSAAALVGALMRRGIRHAVVSPGLAEYAPRFGPACV